MKLAARGGPIVAVAPGPAAWRHHEDALAERVTALHSTASQALAGERNAGVLSRIAAGDLTGAVAALAAWCADHLIVVRAGDGDAAPAGGADAAEELRVILRELRTLGSEVAEHDFGLYARRLADASTAVRRLGAMATSARLVDQALRGAGLPVRFRARRAFSRRLRDLAAVDGAFHWRGCRRLVVRRVG